VSKRVLGVVVATFAAAGALAGAQDAVAPPVALRGALIYTIEGDPIERGTVVLRDGKIVAVGPRDAVEIPEGVETIDAAGQVVIPGLIDAGSFLPLASSERGVAAEPHHRAVDGLDYFSPRMLETVAAGVTTARVLPDAQGNVRGIAGVVKLPAGAAERPRVLAPEAGLLISLGSGDGNSVSAMDAYARYRELKDRLEAARKYAQTWEKYAKDLEEYKKKKGGAPAKEAAPTPAPERPRVRLPLLGPAAKPPDSKEAPEPAKPSRDRAQEALARLFVEGSKIGGEGGRLPLLAEAQTRDEIRFLLKLAEEFKLTFTLVGGAAAHAEAEALAKAKAGVVYGPATLYGPTRARFRDHGPETPARLAAQGVPVAFGSLPLAAAGYPAAPTQDPSRFLALSACRAVAGGLDRKAALKALTRDAAESLGLKDRVGSIFPGKEADLVVLTGEPFELESRVAMVFVDGRRVNP
jgi:imidazolonepropionase-like amidohydrolase